MQTVKHSLLFRRQIGNDPVQEESSLVEQSLGRLHALHHHTPRQTMEASVFIRGQLLASKDDNWQVAQRRSIAQSFEDIEAAHIRQAQVEHNTIKGFAVDCFERVRSGSDNCYVDIVVTQ